MELSTKKISIELLERYFQSPPAFRLEVRNISKGWALDGMFAIPEQMTSRPNFAKILLNKKHPLSRLTMALSNGYVSKAVSTELIEIKNWVYCDDTLIADKFAWAFNQIDDYFLTSVFPCWIPGDIESLVLSALTIFYQYNEVSYDSNKNATHEFKIAMNNSPNMNTIMITNILGDVLIYGNGSEPLVAAYDLYEKVWMLQWNSEAPSITELRKVIDIQNMNNEKVILAGSAKSLRSEYPFYVIGKSSKYKDHECYYGKYKFLEGDFEVFELPFYSEIGSIDTLFEAMKKEPTL